MKARHVLVGIVAIALAWPLAAKGGVRFKVLHNFDYTKDGIPAGALLLGENHVLYGNTYSATFELVPRKNGSWKEVILHSFATHDGMPSGALVRDGAGNLYGTTDGGPISDSEAFELSPGSGGWTFTVLYGKGAGPGLLMDSSGNLYGQLFPGQYQSGDIGELSPSSSGWTYTPLYSFCEQQGCPDGYDLPEPPIWDGKGNMFGTTYRGGNGPPKCTVFGRCGVIFEMTPNGDGTWTYHVLHRFAAYPTDGLTPLGTLVMDASGTFYGTTYGGGIQGYGTAFKLSFSGGRWKKSDIYSFPDLNNGLPFGALVIDKAGNLYGSGGGGNQSCGGFTCGLIFKLTPQKNGKWKYSAVYKFTGGSDGAGPGDVILDDKGNILGVTGAGGKYGFGTAFEITP